MNCIVVSAIISVYFSTRTPKSGALPSLRDWFCNSQKTVMQDSSSTSAPQLINIVIRLALDYRQSQLRLSPSAALDPPLPGSAVPVVEALLH